MRYLAVLFIHFIAALARLLGPGGVSSLVAESLLLKHQLLILNRSRKRSPDLSAWDRMLAGLMAILVRPTRLLRSAIVLKPSTLLATGSDRFPTTVSINSPETHLTFAARIPAKSAHRINTPATRYFWQ
jgi:hypothetical protein